MAVTRDRSPPLGLILIVPLLDTNPATKPDPWGENAISPGLTSDRIMRGLDQSCERVSSDKWY